MRVRRPVLVCFALLAAALTAACEPPLHLTEKPLTGLEKTGDHQIATTMTADVIIETEALLSDALQKVQGARKRVVGWTRNAVCLKRGRSRRCYGGRIDATFVPVAIRMEPTASGALTLIVDADATVATRGLNAGRSVSDRFTHRLSVSRVYDVAFGDGYVPVLKPERQISWTGRKVKVLNSTFDVAPKLAGFMRGLLRRVDPAVRAGLVGAGLARGIGEAWARSAKPLAYDLGRETWFAFAPTALTFDGLTRRDGNLAARLSIRGKATAGVGAPPAATLGAKLPVPADIVPDASEGPTPRAQTAARVPVSIPLALDDMQARIAAAFPTGEIITNRRSAVSPELKLRIDAARLGGAQRYLTLELEAEILAPPRFADTTGRIHLVGRPVVSAKRGTLRLEGAAFPTIGAPGIRRPDVAIPLGPEPFAARFRDAVSGTVGPALAKAASEISAALSRQVAPGVTLSANFKSLEVERVRPADGDQLNVLAALSGTLALVVRPLRLGASETASLRRAEPKPERARQ